MHPFLFRLLLSMALIFQGSAGVCADLPTGMDSSAGSALAAEGAPPGHGCMDCPDCPEEGGQPTGQDCGPACGMLATIDVVPGSADDLPCDEARLAATTPSLVDFLQVPPTPPPIA